MNFIPATTLTFLKLTQKFLHRFHFQLIDRLNMAHNQFDSDDVGIFMKQESVFEPTPMTPTQNRSLLTAQLSPESPNGPQSLQMKRNVSYGNLGNTTEARVLVLYTGGTIGMLRNDKNGEYK
jgi:hypothetical protein